MAYQFIGIHVATGKDKYGGSEGFRRDSLAHSEWKGGKTFGFWI